MPASQITAHRFAQVLVVGALVLWVTERRTLVSLVADRRLAAVHLGAGLLLSVNWLTFVYAVATDRVVDVSLGYFINPLLSVALGLLIGERLTPLRWAAVAAAAVGVAILTVEAGSLPWISLVLATSFAVYGLVKKLSPRDSLGGLTTEMLLLAPFAIGYLLLLSVRGDIALGIEGAVGGASVGAVTIALGFIGIVTATPLALFGAATRRIPLWTIGLLQFLAPSIQFVLGVTVFGEEVSALRLLGFAVIWTGLVIFVVDILRRRPEPEAATTAEPVAQR